MASYNGGPSAGGNGRQGVISHLNVTPSDFELMQQQQQELFNIEEDLALFTDTQFFDWDLGSAHPQTPSFQAGAHSQQQPQPQQQQQHHHHQQQQQQQQQPLAAAGGYEMKNGEFINSEFSLPSSYNLSNMAPQTNHSTPRPIHTQQQQAFSPATATGAGAMSPQHLDSPVSATSMTFSTSKGQRIQGTASALSGKGVNGSETPGTMQHPSPAGGSPDEGARAAAEEDKRRRNTAASARFRVKKKQREQALEKTAKDMTDRVSHLESRVGQLEMENKLLKDLLTEKSGKEVDVAELRRKLEEKAADVKAEA